jgi:hypothetical protein
MENMEFPKAMLAEMDAKLYATQEKMGANTKAVQEKMIEMKYEIKEIMNASRKAD